MLRNSSPDNTKVNVDTDSASGLGLVRHLTEGGPRTGPQVAHTPCLSLGPAPPGTILADDSGFYIWSDLRQLINLSHLTLTSSARRPGSVLQ